MAGLPTQFLMERAFAAQGLDWRAITVEIAETQFETAIQGIAAMNFAAIRLFPSLESQGAERLVDEGSIQKFVGSVTSAAYSNATWDAWNHCGFAMQRLVAGRIAWDQCVCWLHGDSIRTRSLIAALACSGVKPLAIVWTQAPQLELSCLHESLQQLLSADNETLLTESVDEARAFVNPRFEKADETNSYGPKGLLVLADGWLSSFEPDIAAQLQMISELNCDVKLVSSELPHVNSRIEQLRIPAGGLELLDHPELTIAAEAYDFQRWTGYEIEPHLLRDAYDEYCDF